MIDTAVFISGLLLGGFSGLHCVGMCGPIALLVYGRGGFRQVLLYNTGRLMTYAFLGSIIGLLGTSISLVGYQKHLSVVIGIIIILFSILPKTKTSFIPQHWIRQGVAPIKRHMLAKFDSGSSWAFFISGALNGLLPCGMVYLALSAALATGTVREAVQMMLGFGLGTLPLMLGLSIWNYVIKKAHFKPFQFVFPAITIAIGFMIIARGLELQIPYISPLFPVIGPAGQSIPVCGQ